MNYVWGKVKPGQYACRLQFLQNVEDDYELLQGVSRISKWPTDAIFQMNESFPNNLKIEDFIFNINSVLVVSERVRTIFPEDLNINIEYLPVTIINHKGREIKESYYVLNLTILQECIDLNQSEVKFNRIDPDRISIVKKLVIDESRIDQELSIFRMARYPVLPIFHKNAMNKIKKVELNGLKFGEISEWKGK